MINYDDVTGENKTKQNWPYFPEYPFRILIIWGSGQEKRRNYLIQWNVFDYMIAMISNKKLNSIVNELFIRGRKLNVFIIFITKLYFTAPNDDGQGLFTALLRKLQLKDSSNKLQLIIL